MKNKLCRALLLVATISSFGPMLKAGHPYDPADPRPDFLPHRLYYATDSYRKIYNRPRFITGYLGSKFEPTSQEAMSWHDSYCSGMYGTNCRTPVPFYNYLKPWEALDVGPRRDSRLTAAKGPQSQVANPTGEPKKEEAKGNDGDASGTVKASLRDPSKQ